MSRRKPPVAGEFLLFDVLYDDGTRTSNRKVKGDELKEWDFDGSVRAVIEAQDRDIAERSGKPRGAIKAIVPAGGRAGGDRATERSEARNRPSTR
jgi:hypothetical protein